MKKYNLLILVITSILILISCVSKPPKINRGEFLINSSLRDKVVSGETIEVFYHLRKGEKIDYFLVSINNYYDQVSEKYYRPIIQDSIYSFKIKIPHDANSLFVLAGGNFGCFTGGYSTKNFIVYDKNGTIKKGGNGLLVDFLLQKSDTTAADLLIKTTLKQTPDNFMVLDNYWYWLSQNGRSSQLLEEIGKIKKTISGNDDENLAVICSGYYYLDQVDSMASYLEKYLERSPFPGFGSKLNRYLNRLNGLNNRPSNKEIVYQKAIASKCPFSSSADEYLEQAIFLGARDTLAERIIISKVQKCDDDFYFKALYDLQVLKDTISAKKAALKYLDYTKDAFLPNIFSQLEDAVRIPMMNELMAGISGNYKESYFYIAKAIEKNSNIILASPLHAKAAEYAFKNRNFKAAENHIVQICKVGKVGLAKNTLLKLYGKDQADRLLSSFFEKSAMSCEKVPDLTFVIDSLTNFSTNGKRIMFLNLWNPGCVPCIKEIPQLNKLRNSFSSTDIIWLAKDFGGYMNRLPSKFLGWSLYQNDDINKVFYKESVNPQTYIIDKHKKIRCHNIGFDENSMADYKLILELLLEEK